MRYEIKGNNLPVLICQLEKGESMRERVQKYAKVYEEEYRKRPDLWFWFHDRYSFAEMGKKR